MADPTLHEKRPDAEVIVYGDASPITAAEWHCARLVFAWCRGAALRLAPCGSGWSATARGGGCIYVVAVAKRDDAVAGVARMLSDAVRGHTTGRQRNSKRAARLRALIAEGGDRG